MKKFETCCLYSLVYTEYYVFFIIISVYFYIYPLLVRPFDKIFEIDEWQDTIIPVQISYRYNISFSLCFIDAG